MIGYLKGILNWERDNKIIVDVDGVGYFIEITNSVVIPAIGKDLELYIYTYVREDSMTLYGFNNMEERELFTILLSVNGVGPKAAINILSTLTYQRFISAILSENIPALKEISGIGPKTAQRLILELKNKVDKLAVGSMPSTHYARKEEELYEALQGLGYSVREIETAVANSDLDSKQSITEKIKSVLSQLGKGG